MFLECHCTQISGQFKRKRPLKNCPMFTPLSLLSNSGDIPRDTCTGYRAGVVRNKLIALLLKLITQFKTFCSQNSLISHHL